MRHAAHKAVEMCARIKEGKSHFIQSSIITVELELISLSLITGASGMVAAGLVPLCVEKLVGEEATEIRVSQSIDCSTLINVST